MSEQASFCRGPRPAKSLRGCPQNLCVPAGVFAATSLAASLASATPPTATTSAPAARAPEGPKANEGWVGPRLGGRFSPSSTSVLPPPKREGEQRSSWRQPVGFAGLGVGAALLGAGVYSSVRLNGVESQWAEPGFLAYRASTRSPQDSCDAARRGTVSPQAGAASPGQVQSLCSRATTFEALQYAFYGAGALFGGLGAFLLLSGSPSREAPPPSTVAKRSQPPKPSWRLQPNFVRSAATLTLHVRFLSPALKYGARGNHLVPSGFGAVSARKARPSWGRAPAGFVCRASLRSSSYEGALPPGRALTAVSLG